jgi:uncharacterized protein
MGSPEKSRNMIDSTPKKRLSRRDFLKVAGILGLNTVVLGAGGLRYVTNVEPVWIDVNNVHLVLPRLPKSFSGFRVAQISDVHIGPWMSVDRVRSIFKLALNQSPDVIALTGDYVLAFGRVSSYKSELNELAGLLQDVTSRCLTIAVQGNHDYWYNTVEVQDALRRGGVRLLMNSIHTLERNGEQVHIAGVDDVYEYRDDLDAVMTQLPKDGCAILLAHEPDFADTSAATERFDLQLSGHSHGGQVVVPFIGPPVLPDLGKKYPSGLYQVGNMLQYTNRGVGTSIPPVRFNCRPEITIFTLESA